jgi:VWFA-related protein
VRRAATAALIGGAGLAILAAMPAAKPQTAQPQVPSQAARPQAPPQARSVFRAGVEYVAVDVVVTDAHDKLVTDLSVKDFEIREEDRGQRILDFAHVSVPVNHRAVDLHAVPAPPPDVASNPVPSPASRAFVFAIDDGAIRVSELAQLKRVMTSFLQDLAPTDRVAVVYIRRSDLAQDFTSDPGQLVRAVNNINAAIGWQPDARSTRLVLDHVVASLATLPQTRRAVVYVSSGFRTCPDPRVSVEGCAGLDVIPYTVSDVFTQPGLQDLFERARAADVPIYTLDPQGLKAPALNLGGHLEDQTPQNRAAVDTRNRITEDFLRTVPDNTQGLAFVNTNQLQDAVTAIMTDNSDYYVLGYSPSPYGADDKFHPIEVSVVTRPGLHVRARQGYVASQRAPVSDARTRLMAAVGDPELHSDLGLRAFAAPVAAAPNGATAIITLGVSYPALTADQRRTDDDLLVSYVAADPDGHVMKAEPRAFHVALSGTTRDAVDLSVDDVMALPKGRWTLIVGASSRLLGTVGTLHLPVEVRALPGSDLESSPLILGLAAGAPALVAQPESIATLVPFQPTTARTFTSSQQLRVFSRVFAAKPAGLTAELRVTRGGKVVEMLPLRITPTPSVEGAEDCEATLDLKSLPTGDYALEFSARMSRNQTSTRAVGFHVE